MAAARACDFSTRDSNDDDLFHSVVMCEEVSQNEGFSDGIAEGKAQGLIDGWKLGFEKGAAIGSEVGFYKGYTSTLLEFLASDPRPRIQKQVESLKAMLEEFSASDAHNVSMFEDLQLIRDKFKQITSLLNTSHTRGGGGGGAAKDLSF